VTAGRSGARPGARGEGVPALGGGSSVVTVVAVVHAGPHVHPQASLGLLFDLGDRTLGSVPLVSGHGGGGRLSTVTARLGLKGSHGLGNPGGESELLP